MRNAAWLITHFQIKADGKTPYERLRNRAYHGEVVEFAETIHHKEPAKVIDKLDDKWHVGTNAGGHAMQVNLAAAQRGAVDAKDEFVGTPCAPTPAIDAMRMPQVRGVYITLDRQIKHGGTKGCPAFCGQAKVHSAECHARFWSVVGAGGSYCRESGRACCWDGTGQLFELCASRCGGRG